MPNFLIIYAAGEYSHAQCSSSVILYCLAVEHAVFCFKHGTRFLVRLYSSVNNKKLLLGAVYMSPVCRNETG